MYKHGASDWTAIGTFPNMFALFEGHLVAVHVDRFPLSHASLLVQTRGKRCDLPQFVDVHFVKLEFPRFLNFGYLLRIDLCFMGFMLHRFLKQLPHPLAWYGYPLVI